MLSLTQSLVTRYAKLSALKNLIDKWLEGKRAAILEALEKQACPDKGPYVLERKEVMPGPNWKQVFALYLRAGGKSPEEIECLFRAIAAMPREPVVRLEKKINPSYRKTFTVKLPA